MLLALDGVDGAGKSLQCRLLAERFDREGRPCVVMREPGGTAFGERLRAALLDGDAKDSFVEALLFMASRRQLVRERIEPELAAGKVVLLDRSFLSTWVYQGLVGGVDLDFLVDLALRVHGNSWPDRILLLELSRETAARRREQRAGDADAFEDRGRDFLETVREGYSTLAERFPELITRVDANGDVATVHEACWRALTTLDLSDAKDA